MLDDAYRSAPNTWWWVKADGVDVVKGLCESVRGVWSGDVDLNDGKLEQLVSEIYLILALMIAMMCRPLCQTWRQFLISQQLIVNFFIVVSCLIIIAIAIITFTCRASTCYFFLWRKAAKRAKVK